MVGKEIRDGLPGADDRFTPKMWGGTLRTALEGRSLNDDEMQLELGQAIPDVLDEERRHLQSIIDALSDSPSDPKLDAVLYFLLDRRWLENGCIIFSQYYDTVQWAAERLTASLKGETVALYAGAAKSGVLLDGEWPSVEREQIKKAVKDKVIRLVVATDAACEGFNLQTLGHSSILTFHGIRRGSNSGLAASSALGSGASAWTC